MVVGICDVTDEDGARVVTIRSALQVIVHSVEHMANSAFKNYTNSLFLRPFFFFFFFFWLKISFKKIKSEFPQIITLYEHGRNGTKLLHEVDPGEVYNLPIPLFAAKTPLKIGVGCV